MKTHLAAKIQRQNSKQKRFKRRVDELIHDRENTKARRVAPSQQLTKRSPAKGVRQ
jgi:hypothetical protein